MLVRDGKAPLPIQVVAYSGYKANERPLYFSLGEKKIRVVNLLDRWTGVESDYFTVLADDGKVYCIRWYRVPDLWFLVKITGQERRPIGS